MKIYTQTTSQLIIMHNTLLKRIIIALILISFGAALSTPNQLSLTAFFEQSVFIIFFIVAVTILLVTKTYFLKFDRAQNIFTCGTKSLLGTKYDTFKLGDIVEVVDVESIVPVGGWLRGKLKSVYTPHLVLLDKTLYSLAPRGFTVLETFKFDHIGEAISEFLQIPYSVQRLEDVSYAANPSKKASEQLAIRKVFFSNSFLNRLLNNPQRREPKK